MINIARPIDLTPTSETKWNELRQLRDHLLKESDWTQLPDASLDDSKKAAYAVYRQALRDLPQCHNDPFSINIPVAP